MSNIISESVVVYRKLEQVYKESVYANLETPANQLKAIFSELLDEKSGDYFLKKENSVYDTKYYYIKTRVKGTDSFYEKLIRKELGLKLTNSLDLLNKDVDQFVAKKAEIVSSIQKLDDIIGLRIVTELKRDCKSVHSLLMNSNEKFIEKQIKFENLNLQPEKMRNGLDIYRIKGIFQDLFGFELQIKSKIDETWGDLDHTLFYKDYSITPIKDTVQITMNNVGILLDKIENLLYDLRESSGEYLGNSSHIAMQQAFDAELSPVLTAKYGVTYNIREISTFLQHFKSKIKLGDQRITDINFDLLEIEPKSELIINYKRIRQKSLMMMNLEAIYLNWLELSGVEINEAAIDSILEEYVGYIKEFIISNIDIKEFDFNSHINVLIEYEANSEIFLNPLKFQKSIEVQNRIFEIIRDDYDGQDDIPKQIAEAFSLQLFSGDFLRFINDLKNKDIDVNSALFAIKEQVDKSKDKIDFQTSLIANSILENLA